MPKTDPDKLTRVESLVAERLAQVAAGVDGEAMLRRVMAGSRRRRGGRAWAMLAPAAAVAAVAAGLFFLRSRPQVAEPPEPPPCSVAAGQVVPLAEGLEMRAVSAVAYEVLGRDPGAQVHLVRGVADFRAAGGGPLVVTTPDCRVRTAATDFRVDVADPGAAEEGGSRMSVSMARAMRVAVAVAVFTGAVEVTNPSGRVLLAAGEVGVVPRRAAPVRLEKDLGPGVGVTVYNADFAVVKERRVLDLPAGAGVQRFVGVAARIDPTSVHFQSLSDPEGVQVLEQNYEYDLVSPQKILEKYLDRKIALTVAGSGSAGPSAVEGVLKSFADGQITLADAAGNTRIVPAAAVRDFALGALPEGLLTRPTLVWKVAAQRAGRRLCKIAYMTDGISWKCDYIAAINRKHTAADFSGWVTLDNRSGAAYRDARIKLIAGDVRKLRETVLGALAYRNRGAALEEDKAAGFEEKTFAEYHMYTLGRPATIHQNQVKQIELIAPALNVPVGKYYEYPAQTGRSKVAVKIEIRNVKEAGLGIALPKGAVRVHQKDEADGSLEFIGEDQIDHTPRDEKFTLYIGDAFDIVGESTTAASSSGQGWRRQTVRVELRNHKDEPVEVRVPARLGSNWQIESQTLDGRPAEHESKDAFTVQWRVPVKARARAALTYTVFYSWK